MKAPPRDVAITWIVALLVVAGVALWLWLTRPPDNLLPQTYEYGVM